MEENGDKKGLKQIIEKHCAKIRQYYAFEKNS